MKQPRPLKTGECIISYDHMIGGSVYEYVKMVQRNGYCTVTYDPIDYEQWRDILIEADVERFSWIEDDKQSAGGKVKMYGKAYNKKGYSFRDDWRGRNNSLFV